MITDRQTNFVYLSDQLKEKHLSFYYQLTSILNECGIAYDLLTNTRDIWCRDYMPVQFSEHDFLCYNFDPDYLKPKKYADKRTDPESVCKLMGIPVRKSKLKLDGGNLVKGENCIIVTDKIFTENLGLRMSEIRLVSEKKKAEMILFLKTLFKVDTVIVVPRMLNDNYGHADGMLRIYNADTILVNDYQVGPYQSNEQNKRVKELFQILKSNFKEVIRIPFFEVNRRGREGDYVADGCYINYLQVGNTAIIPIFDMPEDDRARDVFRKLFNSVRCIDSREISEYGGVINCATWNIKS